MITFLILSFATTLSAHAQEGASQTAGKSATQSLMAAGQNVAMGAAMFSGCKAPGGQWMCPLAAMSMAQAAADLLTSKSSANAAKSLVGGGDFGSGNWESIDIGGGLTGGQYDSQFGSLDGKFNDLKKEMEKKGIDIDKGTIDTPKGKKSFAGLGSGASLAAEGLIPPDQIEEVDELIAKQNAKLKQITLNTSTGGGGGGGGGRASSSAYDIPSPDYSSLFGNKEKPNAPKTAGLVKTVDGQPYGAAVNNIFDMIRTRYDKKIKENFFVE